MIRMSAFIWLGVLALLSVGLFQVKYSVQGKEAELRQITRQIDANREAIHVMEAEWSYLNDPLRLADLARRHTDLAPAMSTQIATFDQLPVRPPMPAPVPGMPVPDAPTGNAPAQPAPPALLSNAPAQNPPAKAGSGKIVPAVSTATAPIPAGPTDEAGDADAVIDAILADMQKAQQ
jgi:hypothetical protein